MMKRKSLILTSTFGSDNLVVQETEVPDVKPDEVRVRVKACGLNFAECGMRQGNYAPMPTLPTALGFECSGVVEAVGEKTQTMKVGDRVIAIQLTGMWQEVIVVPEINCVIMPDSMTHEDGAAIPVNYVTAYLMLFNQAGLRANQSVLVHMAAGGVGTAVAQLCKTVPGVTVFGTASAGKHEQCKENGITHPIDYNNQDYVEAVKALSPQGVDIVLDPLAGNETSRSYALLKPLGKIITFGASTLVTGERWDLWAVIKGLWRFAKFSVRDLMGQSKCAGGFHLGTMMQNPAHHYIVRDAMSQLMILYREGKIKPCIDSVHTFHNVMDGMRRIYERKNVGKVLLIPTAADDGDQ